MVSAGRLRFGRSDVPDFTVSSRTELTDLITAQGAAGLSGKTVQLNPGDYGLTIIQIDSFNPSQRVVFRAPSIYGTLTPGFSVSGSSKITFKWLRTYRDRAHDTTINRQGAVNFVQNSTDVWFLECEVFSESLENDVDFNGYANVSGVSGTFQNGESVTTSNGGSGVYRSGRPNSTATRFAITGATDDMSGNPTGGTIGSSGNWRPGVSTITGAISGATATFVSNQSFVGDLMDGIGPASNTKPANGLIVQQCYFHDVAWPVNTAGTDMLIDKNEMWNCYTSFGNLTGDISGSQVTANRGINVWARDTDGQCSGTNGPHSSVFGFSQRGWDTDGFLMEGNVFAVGAYRTSVARVGGQGFATGPKMNDVPNPLTATVSGTTMTVTAAGSGGSIGASTPIAVGQRVWGTGIPENTIIAALGTGTGGSGTYILSQSATGATSIKVGSTYSNVTIRSNLFVVNGTGFQFSSAQDSVFAYNTLVADFTTNPTNTLPSFYFNDWLLNCEAYANVSCGFSNGNNAAGDISEAISPTWWTGSYGNWNIFTLSSSSGPPALANQFVGPTFTLSPTATVDDIIAMFATKVGGNIHGVAGHDAYYDFATNTAGPYPTYTKPAPTTASGVIETSVTFPGGSGTNFDRATKGAPSTLWGMASAISKVTFIFTMAPQVNTDAATLMAATNLISLTRGNLASSKNLVSLTFGSAGSIISITGSIPVNSLDTLGLRGSDGLYQLIFTADLANYQFFLQVGECIDPFVTVNTWTGGTLATTMTNMTLCAGTTGTPTAFNIVASQFFFHDDFLDLSQVVNQNKVAALDGRSADLGADGSGVFGVQPRAYLKGTVADWNNKVDGLNLGTGSQKFIMTGAVT